MANNNAVAANTDETAWAETEETADPFATDFFAHTGSVTVVLEESSLPEIAEETVEEEIVNRQWAVNLPQISRDEVRQSLVLTRFPADFAEDICGVVEKTFAQIALQNSSEVSCEILSSAETELNEEITRAASEQAVFINFAIEPERAEAVLVLDAIFAAQIIEKSLGGEPPALVERRELSQIELAVLEFFALNCLRQINEFAGESVFRLRSVRQDTCSTESKRCLLHNVRLRLSGGSGISQLLSPFDFLEGLNNKNFVRNLNRNGKAQIAAFSRITPGVQLHAVLGKTTIDANDLAVLERGDVVIVERQTVRFFNSALSGRAHLRVADEAEPSLYGELTGGESLHFVVREINQRTKNYEPKRLKMPEEQGENQTDNLLPETDEGGLALEKVAVTLTVELASRRLTLDELAQIRAGQTIELGSHASDPVELVADGKTVAIGELVDVEGTLGVRLTRVLL